MSIGKWIVVAFVFFAAFIGTLVAVCVRQDISLVSKSYYREELAYQDQVASMYNASLLEQKPRIDVQESKLVVSFPQGDLPADGQLYLFCPSNAHADKRFALTKDTVQKFDITQLQTGMYKARLSWNAGEKSFFVEEIINL
jgi:hypothetical protein